MPVVFRDNVNKGLAGMSRAEARKLLQSFIDKKEPQLVRLLHNMWHTQGRAITYKQLREMIMAGALSPEIIEDWQQDYSVFVTQYLRPMYINAIEEAAEQIKKKYPAFYLNTAAEGVRAWVDTMGAAFVTNSTAEQIAAIQTVVSRAAVLQDMTVDNLARVIRPMVGLNRPQAVANLNYYNRMIAQGLSETKARENSIKYSARQSMYRGHMIARTELAFAYNKGEHEGVKQAQERGIMGRTVKRWIDAGDERVCDICHGLHERTQREPIDVDAGFGYHTKLKTRNPDIDLTPPAHPHCRCVCIYEEIATPNFTTV